MMIELPYHVQNIIETLHTSGYEAYAVGGCVRDSILGREPMDWDITTSAKPEEVKQLFRRTIDTGIQHGTVTVMIGKIGYEVTTYRIDGIYEDNRHPTEVSFTSNLVEDLQRRDFTINAMAYNEQDGLVDIFGGMEDIKSGVIRCVGEPRLRFDEDALRILRAVRFAAQLGYSIEEATQSAMKEHREALAHISAERIQVELVKTVTSHHPSYLQLAYELHLTDIILPQFNDIMETTQQNPHHFYPVGEHTLCAMEAIRPDKYLRLAMLFHDIGKPKTKTTDQEGIDHFYGHEKVSESIAKSTLKRLRFDNQTISYVTKLVRYHDERVQPDEVSVRKMIYEVGQDIFPLLLEVQEADMAAQSDYKREQKKERLEGVRRCYEKILARGDCLSLATLAITGADLIEIGVPQGKQIGVILKQLLEQVLESPEDNTREVLRTMAEKIAKLNK